MKRRRCGERSGYIVMVSAFLIMLNVVLGVFMINRSQKAIITQIEGRMLDITNTAADMLNGDKLKTLKKKITIQRIIRTLLKRWRYSSLILSLNISTVFSV